jgi:hypothetical protein
MATTVSQCAVGKRQLPWEGFLVVIMLVALVVLFVVVLWLPIQKPDVSLLAEEGKKTVTLEQISTYYDRMLAHRNNVLSLIITAFGAWVGARAAYFFGKENLRMATDKMLAMHQPSARERLSKISIGQMPPLALERGWQVTRETKVSEVKDHLYKHPEYWFVPVVTKDWSLDTVIKEESVYRYLLENPLEHDATINDVLAYVDSLKPEAVKEFKGIHVVVRMDTTAGDANDMMEGKNVDLAIVVSDNKPTHFITSAEVRKLLLQEEAA